MLSPIASAHPVAPHQPIGYGFYGMLLLTHEASMEAFLLVRHSKLLFLCLCFVLWLKIITKRASVILHSEQVELMLNHKLQKLEQQCYINLILLELVLVEID